MIFITKMLKYTLLLLIFTNLTLVGCLHKKNTKSKDDKTQTERARPIYNKLIIQHLNENGINKNSSDYYTVDSDFNNIYKNVYSSAKQEEKSVLKEEINTTQNISEIPLQSPQQDSLSQTPQPTNNDTQPQQAKLDNIPQPNTIPAPISKTQNTFDPQQNIVILRKSQPTQEAPEPAPNSNVEVFEGDAQNRPTKQTDSNPNNIKPITPTTTGIAKSGNNTGQYFIQVGSFRSEKTAKQISSQVQKVTNQNVNLSDTDVGSQTFHRVRVGPFEDKSVAEKELRSIIRSGFYDVYLINYQ